MTFTSYGYGGSIDEPALAQYMVYAGGSLYGVRTAVDWKVTALPTPARTVQVALGIGWGRGVLDSTDAPETVQLPTIAAGERWDLIVARRNWATNTTTFGYVLGSAARALPARTVGWGAGIDEQPLALVRLVAGQSVPVEVVDLRVWTGDGGAFANDLIVRSYMTRVGTQLRIGKVPWELRLNAQGSPTWVTDELAARYWTKAETSVRNFSGLGAMVGVTVPALPPGDFKIEAHAVVKTQAAWVDVPLTKRLLVNGLLIGSAPADDLPAGIWQTRDHHLPHRRPDGAQFTVQYDLSAEGPVTVKDARITVYYLGPIL